MRLPKETDIVQGIIKREERRQEQTLNLIASENYIPSYIRAASASMLVNKYAEGYPGKRYYPGTKYYDLIEHVAKERALELFGLFEKSWHVNVQPYSGAIANMEAYLAFLSPGDLILSLALASGGHLSHGASASHTDKLFRVERYHVTKKYDIDYAALRKQVLQTKPKLIVSGASAFPKKIDFKKIGEIARGAGALHLADISHYAGLVSAKQYPNPFPHADMVMTTTHKSLFGPKGAILFAHKKSPLLQQAGIDPSRVLDKAVFPGMQGGPHMHSIAGIAMGLEFSKENAPYYVQVRKNAQALASALKRKGYDTCGGTQSHMVLVRVAKKGMDGLKAEQKLEKSGIYANRNAIEGDVSVQRPSAVRFGAYAVTYRGMKEKEMQAIAGCIDDALSKGQFYGKIKMQVRDLCKRFPIPEI